MSRGRTIISKLQKDLDCRYHSERHDEQSSIYYFTAPIGVSRIQTEAAIMRNLRMPHTFKAHREGHLLCISESAMVPQ